MKSILRFIILTVIAIGYSVVIAGALTGAVFAFVMLVNSLFGIHMSDEKNFEGTFKLCCGFFGFYLFITLICSQDWRNSLRKWIPF